MSAVVVWLRVMVLPLAAVFVAAACGAPPGPQEPAEAATSPAPPGPVRIATYNVENLFDPVPDNGGAVIGEALSTPEAAEYSAKVRGLGVVLGRLAADILVLQEVEGRRALDDLAAEVGEALFYPHRVLFAGNDPRGIDLAVLSRLPIARIVRHHQDWFRVLDADCSAGSSLQDGPYCWDHRYARDCLELHLTVRGQPLVLLGLHLKAREDGDIADDAKRLAEAQHTRRLADRLLGEAPHRPVVILGDFNAWPGQPELLALLGDPARCACEGTPFFPVGDALDGADAHTTASVEEGRRARYDDLLLSPGAAAAADFRTVDIVHDEDVPAGAAASDHDPVAVTLWLGSEP